MYTPPDTPDHLFTLKIWTVDGDIFVSAFDDNTRDTGSRFGIQAEVLFQGRLDHEPRVIFEKGFLWCSLGAFAGHSTDGHHARELVLDMVSKAPGDTESEYFDNYTFEQLEFVKRFGDDIKIARDQYCDPANGEPLKHFDTEQDPLELR